MTNDVFVHVPYARLGEHLETLVTRRINPELFFPAETLDSLIPEELAAYAATLAEHGLSTTIHAPFMDLNPGSLEPLLRDATLHRFRQVLDVAAVVRPRVMVFHPGYDRWRYGGSQEAWLKHSIDAWQMVLGRTEGIGCTVAVENIFEEEPSTLRVLLEALDAPRLRHCFDVGHWNLFHRVEMEEWFAELGKHIAHVHVHDNYGTKDDHAPIGEGNIDFDLYFRLMKTYAPDATYTIEAHDRQAVDRALTRLHERLDHA
ncbi:MAG TPA: sugar phosphate isomerase/epimerase family protein [Geobacteraceae bacterium]